MSLRYLTHASVIVLAAASLAACRMDGSSANNQASADSNVADALPLTTSAQAYAPAPPVESLPRAPAPRVVYVNRPAEAYQYADDAYAMNDAFGDAPPDYSFDYDGSRPYVWRSDDNAMRVVEYTSEGDRYYYYRPGQSDPYLVRDPHYAYAYSGGELVTVYDDRGRVVSERDLGPRTDYAGRYLARARAIEAAAYRDRREQIAASNWAAERDRIARDRARERDQQRQSREWLAYHDQHEADQRAQWQAEQARRERAAHDFDGWKDRGYQGAPPPPVRVVYQRPDNRPDSRPNNWPDNRDDRRDHGGGDDRGNNDHGNNGDYGNRNDRNDHADRSSDNRDDHQQQAIAERQHRADLKAQAQAQVQAQADARAKAKSDREALQRDRQTRIAQARADRDRQDHMRNNVLAHQVDHRGGRIHAQVHTKPGKPATPAAKPPRKVRPDHVRPVAAVPPKPAAYGHRHGNRHQPDPAKVKVDASVGH